MGRGGSGWGQRAELGRGWAGRSRAGKGVYIDVGGGEGREGEGLGWRGGVNGGGGMRMRDTLRCGGSEGKAAGVVGKRRPE